jgi:peptidoglycan/xylan/chitin deacetylase (PgdA/CDA1 family)
LRRRAHTRDLTTLGDDEVERELSESRRTLEASLGTTIISVAYPFGNSTPRVRALAARAGYRFGVATDSGGMHVEDDRFEVFRVNVFPGDGWWQLKKKTSPRYRSRFRRTRGR